MTLNLNTYIDHTLLKPEASKENISTVCQEAKDYHFAAVCINPIWVKHAAEQLYNSNVHVCTVVGFPLGATTTATKVAESQQALKDGAQEIDMVINIAAAKAHDMTTVLRDIKAVVEVTYAHQGIVKVIIETGLLERESKILASQAAQKAGADFVKTSTGFNGGGATKEDILLMRKTIGPDMGLKASGGIKDAEQAKQFIDAGATRLGTSSGVRIMQGKKGLFSY